MEGQVVSSKNSREIESRTIVLEEAMKYTSKELVDLRDELKAGFAQIKSDMMAMQTWFETHTNKFATKNELELLRKDIEKRLEDAKKDANDKALSRYGTVIVTALVSSAITGLVAFFIQRAGS